MQLYRQLSHPNLIACVDAAVVPSATMPAGKDVYMLLPFYPVRPAHARSQFNKPSKLTSSMSVRVHVCARVSPSLSLGTGTQRGSVLQVLDRWAAGTAASPFEEAELLSIFRGVCRGVHALHHHRPAGADAESPLAHRVRARPTPGPQASSMSAFTYAAVYDSVCVCVSEREREKERERERVTLCLSGFVCLSVPDRIACAHVRRTSSRATCCWQTTVTPC
jgi:hypothetical protein